MTNAPKSATVRRHLYNQVERRRSTLDERALNDLAELGWSLEERTKDRRLVYVGHYRCRDTATDQRMRCPGRIIRLPNGRFEVCIRDLPATFDRHPNFTCFTPRGDSGWFHVHWDQPPTTVFDAIFAIERILDEAINRYADRPARWWDDFARRPELEEY